MTEKKAKKFKLHEFRAISHAISTYENLNMLMVHIVEGVCMTFKIKGACVLLYDDREKQLFIVSSHGISKRYLNKGPIFCDDKHTAFNTGEPVYIEDMQKDDRVQYPEAAAEEGIVSMLSVPIKCRRVSTGIVRLYHSEPMNVHDEDIESLCVLTEHLGLLIENNGLKNFLEGLKILMGSLPLRLLENKE